jgi:hypothetical protein
VPEQQDSERTDSKEKDALSAYQAQFFKSDAMRQIVRTGRNNYPKGRGKPKNEDNEDGSHVHRRIMGFGLGFEKIFATTSIKLPVTAYTIYAEMHLAHKSVVLSRVFNGLNTVFDLKKWVYEKLWVPITAYELSYAEPGKAALTDQLRLLTTDDSIDQRTFATTRAVHGSYTGTPGVHSIGDIGVTRLYVRLKCRKCGDLLNDLQTCRKFKIFGEKDAIALNDISDELAMNAPQEGHSHMQAALLEARAERKEAADALQGESSTAMTHTMSQSEARDRNSLSKLKRQSRDKPGREQHPDDELTAFGLPSSRHGRPGTDPQIEDCWYRPDDRKHCLFHSRGYEMYEGARTHGAHAELARIYISCETEPSKKLRLRDQVLAKDGAHMHIGY